MRFSITFLSVIATLLAAVQAGGYGASCWNKRLNGQFIDADCRRTDGSVNHNRYDLNRCLTNRGGTLWWAVNGGAMGSCHSGEPGQPWDDAAGRFDIDCHAGGQRWYGNAINTSDGITNRNGEMVCDNRIDQAGEHLD